MTKATQSRGKKPAPESKAGAKAKPAAKPQQRKAPRASASQFEDAVATTLFRQSYVRERHFFLMRIIFVLLLLLAISLAWNIYLTSREVKPTYFATSSDGRIMELTPLNRPVQSRADLLNWTTKALTELYTYNFSTWRKDFSEAKDYFTTNGWTAFEKAMEDSGVLETVISNKLIVTAVPTDAPVIVNEGEINGRYAWRIQVPMLVTFESANDKHTDDFLIKVVVVRRPETENPKGLGIEQFVAQRR